MCSNREEEKMSRAAAFITDWSRDRRCDGIPATVALPYSPVEGGETTPRTGGRIWTLTDGDGCSAADAVYRKTCTSIGLPKSMHKSCRGFLFTRKSLED